MTERPASRDRRAVRWTCAGAAAALLALGPASIAVAQTDRDPGVQHVLPAPFTTWLGAVVSHEPGALDASAHRIATWDQAALHEALRELEVLERVLVRVAEQHQRLRVRGAHPDGHLQREDETQALLQPAPGVPDPRAIMAELTNRAVLLHTDIAVLIESGHLQPPPSAATDIHGVFTVRDGAALGLGARWPHWDMARDLWARGKAERADRDHARRWYEAVAAYLYGRADLAGLLAHLGMAGRQFRDDAGVAYWNGLLHARLASPPMQQAARRAWLPPGRVAAISDQATHLRQAQAFFARALALDAERVEARVRLAHVLNELQRHAEAAALLEDAPLPKTGPVIQYYAALFLGEALAEVGEPDEARAAFERAAALFPRAQAPWLSLSRLAHARRDRAAAAEALAHAFEVVRRHPDHEDPWWAFHIGEADAPDRQLRHWRLTVVPAGGAR